MKKLLALILALAMCFALVACGGEKAEEKPAESKPAAEESKAPAATEVTEETKSEADEWRAKSEGKKYNVLYIPSWAASEYFQNTHVVWGEQFAELGWNLDMQGPEKYTAESQLAVLESALLSQKYDAIFLYPIDPESVNAVLDEMWDTYQTPIVQWGFPESFGGGHYFIATDDRYKVVGDYMVDMALEYVEENMDYFKAEYLDKGKKIPYAASGSAKNSVQNTRLLRCIELLDADGRFEMVEHFENVGESEALAYGETLALNHPEVEIVMCYNDVHGINYITAFETAGVGSDYLRFFGTDGTKAARTLMAEQGESCKFGGTSSSNHKLLGNIIINIMKGAIPAAEEGEIVRAITDEAKAEFAAACADGTAQDNITWENVADFLD